VQPATSWAEAWALGRLASWATRRLVASGSDATPGLAGEERRWGAFTGGGRSGERPGAWVWRRSAASSGEARAARRTTASSRTGEAWRRSARAVVPSRCVGSATVGAARGGAGRRLRVPALGDGREIPALAIDAATMRRARGAAHRR
jgi:hypothetical protein